jgi:hypothetical protein
MPHQSVPYVRAIAFQAIRNSLAEALKRTNKGFRTYGNFLDKKMENTLLKSCVHKTPLSGVHSQYCGAFFKLQQKFSIYIFRWKLFV